MKKVILFLISISIIGGSFYAFQYINKEQTLEEVILRPIATITLENGAQFTVELYPDEAPNTVNNFIALADISYYNDMGFNKLIPDYLVQTGDKRGDGTGFPGYFITSECEKNGYKNDLPLEAGTVCMSRGGKYNTEGSQFFILLTARADLEGDYTAFGKVTNGLELLTLLSEQAPDMKTQKEEGVQIKSIIVNTFGQHYEKPHVLSVAEVTALK